MEIKERKDWLVLYSGTRELRRGSPYSVLAILELVIASVVSVLTAIFITSIPLVIGIAIAPLFFIKTKQSSEMAIKICLCLMSSKLRYLLYFATTATLSALFAILILYAYESYLFEPSKNLENNRSISYITFYFLMTGALTFSVILSPVVMFRLRHLYSFAIICLFSKAASSLFFMLRHPLHCLSAIPENWTINAMKLDSTVTPEVISGIRKRHGELFVGKEGNDDVGLFCKNPIYGPFVMAILFTKNVANKIDFRKSDSVSEFMGHVRERDKVFAALSLVSVLLDGVVHMVYYLVSGIIILTYSVLIFIVFYVPVLSYRWSMKSSAIWFYPIAYMAHGAYNASLADQIAAIKEDAICGLLRWIGLFSIVTFVLTLLAGGIIEDLVVYSSGINERLGGFISEVFPERKANLWQAASAVSALMSWGLYRYALSPRACNKTLDMRSSSLIKTIIFVRGIISLYVITCLGYIIINFAMKYDISGIDFGRLFPWQNRG